MANAFHDPDLVMHLMPCLSVFDKAAFFNLLAGVDSSMLDGRQLVDHGKSPLADIADNVVGLAAIPLHAVIVLSCSRGYSRIRR